MMTPDLPTPSTELNKDGYPVNWDEIATVLKDWAAWKCEHCFIPHNEPPEFLILTVHHLNGIKTDCRFENLLVCCQRCHLHIQAKFKPGQSWMFGRPFWSFIRGL